MKQGPSPHAHLVQDSSMEAVPIIHALNVEEEDDHHPIPTTEISNINSMIHVVLLIIMPF